MENIIEVPGRPSPTQLVTDMEAEQEEGARAADVLMPVKGENDATTLNKKLHRENPLSGA